MRAIEFLAKARLAGHKPAVVWLLVGNYTQPQFWRWPDPQIEIAVKAERASARLDWRPLVGCDVMILADTRSDALREIVRRLESIAARMTVCVIDRLPDTLGHVWERGAGWREWCRPDTCRPETGEEV